MESVKTGWTPVIIIICQWPEGNNRSRDKHHQKGRNLWVTRSFYSGAKLWNWHLFMFFWLAQLIPGGLTTPSFFLFLQGFLACILTIHQSLTDVFRYIRSWYHLTDAAAWWMIPPTNSCKVYLSCCHPSNVSPLLNSYCCTKVTMWNCLLSTESIVMRLWFALFSIITFLF